MTCIKTQYGFAVTVNGRTFTAPDRLSAMRAASRYAFGIV